MKLCTDTISKLPSQRNKKDKLNIAEMPREERERAVERENSRG